MAKKSWYSIVTAKAGGVPEVLIYDEIGAWGVSPTSFYEALRDLGLKAGDKAVLRINSPGGDVFAGNTIYNMLLDTEADWTIYIDGVAASMASLIATLPGAHVIIAANAFIMIHNPAAWAAGESKDMKRTAALLDSIRDTMVRAYSDKTGLEDSEIEAMLDAETWLDADEAVAMGFADEKGKENRLAAKFDLESKFKDIPAQVVIALGKAAKPAPQPKESKMDKTEMIAAVTEANKPLSDAIGALVTALTPKAPAKPDANAIPDTVEGYEAYTEEVHGLCELTGFPEEARGFIKAKMPLADIRAKLTEKKAAAEASAKTRRSPAPLTGRIDNRGGAETEVYDHSDLVKALDPDKIWANYNKKKAPGARANH